MIEAVGAVLTGVWKRYSRRGSWVLQDVDLTVGPGAVHVLVGGNGEGKSTLLRVVAGASVPSRGRVRRPVRSVAYAPERLPADVRMTAASYLGHQARLRGHDHAAVLTRSMGMLDRLGLQPGAEVPLRLLSKGNRQKVALVQALGAAARLTVLDEPFSGLDQEAAAQVRALLGEIRDDGRSVLLSAHHTGPVEPGEVVHRLAGGRLEPLRARANPTTTRLVLRAGAEQTRAGGELIRLAAELGEPEARVRPGAEPGLVVVLTTDPDRVLAAALVRGWSFVEGGPQLRGNP